MSRQLSSRGRKLTLALHISTSVGWMGLSLSMATLAVIGYFTTDPGVAEGAYYAMYVFDETTVSIVGLASLITGVLLGTGTPWGLLRHWWVVVKGSIALFMLVFAWAYTHPLVITAAEQAGEARGGYTPSTEGTILLWTVPPLFVLLVYASIISVYKPWGRTPRGRTYQAARTQQRTTGTGTDTGTAQNAPEPQKEEERATQELAVTVDAVDEIADGVADLHLVPASGEPVAPWTPGAHIDLVLPSGRLRQYSLHGDPADRSAYRVAVLREPTGRGGSLEVHGLRAGDHVAVRGPRNHFPLAETGSYVFIAGGIGIVPFLPMIQEVERRGAQWRLVYVGRTRAAMAFAEELDTAYGPEKVALHARDVTDRPDLSVTLANAPAGTAVYVCGPSALMDAVQELMPSSCPEGTLHLERFEASEKSYDPADNTPFEVELAGSGEVVTVPADTSMLDTLRESVAPGLSASCEDGLCGSCELRVLRGVPEHRDDVLSPADRDRTDVMYPCVSRIRGDRVVVDL
ncbi:PDR/VanB family oxidoreductase [Streptomyces sp. NPDC002851]